MPLHEEEHGKLFPDANRSRVVLRGAAGEADRLGVRLQAGERVQEVVADGEAFRVRTSNGEHACGRVVLATGGLSLPKTGSDGHGLEVARRFGHAVVPTTPALVPLVLAGPFHAPLSGVAHEAELMLCGSGGRPDAPYAARCCSPTSGSADRSCSTCRGTSCARGSKAPRRRSRRTCSRAEISPRSSAGSSGWPPRRRGLAPSGRSASGFRRRSPKRSPTESGCAGMALGQVTRDARKRLVRGTSSGPSRSSTAAATRSPRRRRAASRSRRSTPPRWSRSGRAGLLLVGEMLDVDGRIGGFNFQWAWSSGWVAAGGLARRS